MKIAVFLFVLGVWAQAAPGPTPVVFTSKAHQIDVFDLLTYPARVESKVNASIFAETDGIISKIVSPLGARVTRHTKLIVIRHTDPVYEYAPFTLVSPVEGIVSQVIVTEGSRVTKGQQLMTVTDPSKIRLMIEVAAEDLQSVRTGMMGEFVISGRDKSLQAKVIGASPFVDPGTGTATCELEVTHVI